MPEAKGIAEALKNARAEEEVVDNQQIHVEPVEGSEEFAKEIGRTEGAFAEEVSTPTKPIIRDIWAVPMMQQIAEHFGVDEPSEDDWLLQSITALEAALLLTWEHTDPYLRKFCKLCERAPTRDGVVPHDDDCIIPDLLEMND